jgi:hypothetical protein
LQTKNNLEREKERWEVKKVEEVNDGEEGEEGEGEVEGEGRSVEKRGRKKKNGVDPILRASQGVISVDTHT